MPETGAESAGNTRVDVIVVGGGLAGTILAWTLRQRGLQTAVFDDPGRSTCSRIAAGLFNPVTGQEPHLRAELTGLLASIIELVSQFFSEKYDRFADGHTVLGAPEAEHVDPGLPGE